MKMRVEIRGTDDLRKALEALGPKSKRALARALFREGEEIMGNSKEHHVPVRDGVLRGSGHVQPPEVTDHQVVVTLGYGGAASAYALRQHEEVGWHHTVGGAKYLERPTLEAAKGMGERLAAEVKKDLR